MLLQQMLYVILLRQLESKVRFYPWGDHLIHVHFASDYVLTPKLTQPSVEGTLHWTYLPML